MGDRGNIVMEYGDGKQIYFYTHWRGSEIAAVLTRALQRKQRWNDPSYLARIIFCELVRGEESNETGYGISPYLTDNEHDLLSVNPQKQTVRKTTEKGRIKQTWTFEEFLNQEN